MEVNDVGTVMQNDQDQPRDEPASSPQRADVSGSSAGSGGDASIGTDRAATVLPFGEMFNSLSAEEQDDCRRWLYLQPDELRGLSDGVLCLTIGCPKCNVSFILREFVPGSGQKLQFRTMPCQEYCGQHE